MNIVSTLSTYLWSPRNRTVDWPKNVWRNNRPRMACFSVKLGSGMSQALLKSMTRPLIAKRPFARGRRGQPLLSLASQVVLVYSDYCATYRISRADLHISRLLGRWTLSLNPQCLSGFCCHTRWPISGFIGEADHRHRCGGHLFWDLSKLLFSRTLANYILHSVLSPQHDIRHSQTARRSARKVGLYGRVWKVLSSCLGAVNIRRLWGWPCWECRKFGSTYLQYGSCNNISLDLKADMPCCTHRKKTILIQLCDRTLTFHRRLFHKCIVIESEE